MTMSLTSACINIIVYNKNNNKHTIQVEQAKAQCRDTGHQADISTSELPLQQMTSDNNHPSTATQHAKHHSFIH